MLKDKEITGAVVDAAIKIHKRLGPGLFESVYQRILPYELEQRGLRVQPKEKLPLQYGALVIPEAFEVDLIVEDRVIVEIKSVEQLSRVHAKQLMTYLRLTGIRFGLLINFNVPLLKDGIVRLVNGFESAHPDTTSL